VFTLPVMGHDYVHARKLRELKGEARQQQESPRRLTDTGSDDDDEGDDNADHELGMSALYQGYGTHYVDLWVGTPTPQRQTVIVDTGSSITAFPCAGCRDCGWESNGDQFHTDNYFDWQASATFRKLGCNECQAGSCSNHECKMHMAYAEGSSWSAFESQDYLYAGGSHDHAVEVKVDPVTGDLLPLEDDDGALDVDVKAQLVTKFEVPYNFGCQQSLTGLFRTQLADGIMGMSNEQHTFWHQLYQSGKLTQKLFSLCFSRSDSIDYEGTGAGAMTIGGSNTVLHKTPMVYIHETKGRGFFTVHVRKVFLRNGGGESAAFEPTQTGFDMHQLDISEESLNSSGVIFDSGTTDTYFTREMASTFKVQWKELTGMAYDNKPFEDVTIEQIKTFPTIIVQLQGVDPAYYHTLNPDQPPLEPQHVVGLAGEMDQEHPYDVYLAIPASHYFEFDDEKGTYTPRIYLDERSGSVLGANAMQGHDIFFNIEDQVIGIAESDCNFLDLNLPGGIHEDQATRLAVEPVPGGVSSNSYNTKDYGIDGSDNAPGVPQTLGSSGGSIPLSYHGAFSNSDEATMCGQDSLLCKGLFGLGGLFFIVGIVVGLPKLRSWRATRALYTVHHAVEEADAVAADGDTMARDLSDFSLDDDDDMNDHNMDGIGVEIMTADRRSIV